MKASRVKIGKEKILLGFGLLIFFAVVYLGRGYLRDAWDYLRRPRLPEATAFRPPVVPAAEAVEESASPFEAGYSTSENYVLETSPRIKKMVDPLAFKGILPAETNLDVPFMSQAPSSDWSMPYQEACEEASLIMIDAFYRGSAGRISKEAAETAIKKLVAFEEGLFGYYEDTTAEETAKLAKEYFGYDLAIVRKFKTAEDLKGVLALGYPVILPAAGKMLNNPNFRNGGPLYHMLVIRGYTPKYFITNDPGTRKGQGYAYDYATLVKAAHDWNGGKVTEGEKLMIVILPKT